MVKEHIAQFSSIEKALDSKTLKKNPIIYKGKTLSEVFCFEEIYTIRKPIDDNLNITKVLDKAAQKVLYKRLNEYGGNATKAFSDLEKNPIWLNEEQGICIKSVTIKTSYKRCEALRSKRTQEGKLILDESGRTIPIDYIRTGNNHHIAIYRDANGTLYEQVVSFLEAVTRANNGLSVIDKHFNKELGWEFLFTLKKNEMFVFPNPKTGFDPREIDLLDPQNKALISPNLYRVERISSKDYRFCQHLETTKKTEGKESTSSKNDTTKSEDKDLTLKRIRTTKSQELNGCIKVRLNHLGDIVHIGEY